ncbi:MAG TPA: hypothetical protein VF950_28090 [Planctomycetota bacterium]
MNKQEAFKHEQLKFRDEAMIFREREAAVAALSFSTFITAIGPLGIMLMKVVNGIPVGWFAAYCLYATAPLGLLLTMINYFRTPKDFRGSKLVLRPVLIAVAAAVATFVLAGYWGLMKKAVGVDESP